LAEVFVFFQDFSESRIHDFLINFAIISARREAVIASLGTRRRQCQKPQGTLGSMAVVVVDGNGKGSLSISSGTKNRRIIATLRNGHPSEFLSVP
jgi:hypothetical protein